LLSLMQASGTTVPDVADPRSEALRRLAHLAGLTVWLYWAGIVGGLLMSVGGGALGARSEGRAARRIGVRIPPTTATTTPGVPQPA
jgi:hypothetical protein